MSSVNQEEGDVWVTFDFCEEFCLHLRLLCLQESIFAFVTLIHSRICFLMRSKTVVALAVQVLENMTDVV